MEKEEEGLFLEGLYLFCFGGGFVLFGGFAYCTSYYATVVEFDGRYNKV